MSEELSPEVQAYNDLVQQLSAAAKKVMDAGLAGQVTDEALTEPLYVAARMFSNKTDRVGKTEWPVSADALNATDTVVLVTALLEAADVNLFDMAIWYRRL
jgi:hypothetical protein